MMVAIAGLAACLGTGAGAGETNTWREWVGVEGAVDLGSAYVDRGETLNDGMVLQPTASLRVWRLSGGAWFNVDLEDSQGALEPWEASEIQVFGGLDLSISRLAAGVQYTYYAERRTHRENLRDRLANRTWTDAERDVMRDQLDMTGGGGTSGTVEDEGDGDTELSAWLAYDGAVKPCLTVHRGLSGDMKEELYVVPGLSFVYYDKGGWVLDAGASVTYFDDGADASGWTHVEFTHTITWKCLRATFHHMQVLDEDLLVDADDGGPFDIRNYGSIGVFYEI